MHTFLLRKKNLPAFVPFTRTPSPCFFFFFFKSPRPCRSCNVIISRLKARLLIIVLYVTLCLVSDSIHLRGHHFITFFVAEVKKINGNQITLLTERLRGRGVKFTGRHLSFKTFRAFFLLLLFIFIIIYSTEPGAFPNTECGLAFVFCRARRFFPLTDEVGDPWGAGPMNSVQRGPLLPLLTECTGPVPKDAGRWPRG